MFNKRKLKKIDSETLTVVVGNTANQLIEMLVQVSNFYSMDVLAIRKDFDNTSDYVDYIYKLYHDIKGE